MSAKGSSLELLASDGRRFHCRSDPRQPLPVRGRFGRVFQVRIRTAEVADSVEDGIAAVYCAENADRRLIVGCNILAQLRHDHIVRLIAVTRDAESATSMCVLLEWLGAGSLHDLIDRSGCLVESCIAAYGKQIGSALHYLHSHSPPILHRNVKCRTALLTDSGCAKLAGFTICCRLDECNDNEADSEVGTAIDVRQFGSFLIEMATGRAGCQEAPADSPKRLRGLCDACAARRPSGMAQLLRHEFFE